MQEEPYSEVAVSEGLRVHQRAMLGGSAVPKTVIVTILWVLCLPSPCTWCADML